MVLAREGVDNDTIASLLPRVLTTSIVVQRARACVNDDDDFPHHRIALPIIDTSVIGICARARSDG